jgi:hypothetical protein
MKDNNHFTDEPKIFTDAEGGSWYYEDPNTKVYITLPYGCTCSSILPPKHPEENTEGYTGGSILPPKHQDENSEIYMPLRYGYTCSTILPPKHPDQNTGGSLHYINTESPVKSFTFAGTLKKTINYLGGRKNED